MSWTLDKARKVWVASSYSDLDASSINSLAEYGEPFSPYEHPGWVDDFDPDFENVVIEMSQAEVMYHGYGRSLTPGQFAIVQRFLDGSIAVPPGTYSFADLVKLKLAVSGDRWFSTSLYPWGAHAIDSGDIDPGDAAYIHGSVAFALQKETRFSFSGGVRKVEAWIGAGEDNWDFTSGNVGAIAESAAFILFGPDHYNLVNPIRIVFTGPGRRYVMENRNPVHIATNPFPRFRR